KRWWGIHLRPHGTDSTGGYFWDVDDVDRNSRNRQIVVSEVVCAPISEGWPESISGIGFKRRMDRCCSGGRRVGNSGWSGDGYSDESPRRGHTAFDRPFGQSLG